MMFGFFEYDKKSSQNKAAGWNEEPQVNEAEERFKQRQEEERERKEQEVRRREEAAKTAEVLKKEKALEEKAKEAAEKSAAEKARREAEETEKQLVLRSRVDPVRANNLKDVNNVRNAMRTIGRYPLSTNSVSNPLFMDPVLNEKVRHLQKEKGLAVDGLINPVGETASAINNELKHNSLFKKGNVSLSGMPVKNKEPLNRGFSNGTPAMNDKEDRSEFYKKAGDIFAKNVMNNFGLGHINEKMPRSSTYPSFELTEKMKEDVQNKKHQIREKEKQMEWERKEQKRLEKEEEEQKIDERIQKDGKKMLEEYRERHGGRTIACTPGEVIHAFAEEKKAFEKMQEKALEQMNNESFETIAGIVPKNKFFEAAYKGYSYPLNLFNLHVNKEILKRAVKKACYKK